MHLDLPTRDANLLSAGGHGVRGSRCDGSESLLRLLGADRGASCFLEALVASGLSARLTGPGPFTVLLPSNAAFADLLVELGLSKGQLLANPRLLRGLMGCHLLGGRLTRQALMAEECLAGAPGEHLSLNADGLIGDANGRQAALGASDLPARNGIVHSLDRVLLPRTPTLLQALHADEMFSLLLEALQSAGLTGILSGPAPLTLLAPRNSAFEALWAELGLSRQQLWADRALLTQILTLHLLGGRRLREDFWGSGSVRSLQGGLLRVAASAGVTDRHGRCAGLGGDDRFALNGQLHALDRVLMP